MCSILVSVVFLLYSDDLTDDVSTNIAIYADDAYARICWGFGLVVRALVSLLI